MKPSFNNDEEELCSKFHGYSNRHKVSNEAASCLWEFFKANCEKMHNLSEQLVKFNQIRRRAEVLLPPITFSYVCVNEETDEQLTFEEQPSISCVEGFKRLYEIGAVKVNITKVLQHCNNAVLIHVFQIQDIRNFHCTLHGIDDSIQLEAMFSTDGMQECNSSSRSLNIFSLKFDGCCHVYPVAIIRPNCLSEKYTLDWKPTMVKIIQELRQC